MSLVSVLFLFAGQSVAATYYVSPAGNDETAPGTEAAPWKTIKHAVDTMVAGDTTYVRSGTYQEPPIFKQSGTAAAPIKLLNAPGESPVVDCGNHDFNYPRFQNGAGYTNPIGHITIEGFEIRNCRHGMVMYNGYNLTIRGNWIHHSRAQGIHGNGKNILIDRNVINRNGTFSDCGKCNLEHGIYGTGPNWVITNNLIFDNLANGIVVAGYPRCVVSGCEYIKKYTDDSYGGANNWLIANNTIAYNNYRDAIVLWQPLTTNSKIINNIFYENSQKYSGGVNGISFFSSPGGGHLFQNNICYATAPGSTPCIATNGTGKYTQSGNIINTLDPKFVNAPATMPSTPNFMLTSKSPAINAGINLFASGVTIDFGGKARPKSGSFEIGAYEYDNVSPIVRPAEPGGFTVH